MCKGKHNRLQMTMKVHPFCLLLLSVVKLASFCVQAESNSSESYLIRQVLMKNYDPLTRPVANWSESIDLTISMGLKSFIQLDMKKQTLVSFGWLTVSWYDQFLRWDLNQYPFYRVLLTTDMVWRPDLVIFNTVNDLDQLEDQKIKVVVEYTGKVEWYPGGLFETFCSINILYYPFDIQTCTVEVSPWSSSIDILKATVDDPAFQTDDGTEDHPEWRLVSQKAVHSFWPTNQWRILFSYVLERRVVFYVFNMILPIVLLSLMNCLVFLLPADSGEKMTVSITVFLSFAVFLSLINNSLPPNSDSLCLFSLFVAVQMLISVCSIITAAYVTFLYEKDKDSCAACHCQPQTSTENMTTSFGVNAISYANRRPKPVVDSVNGSSAPVSPSFPQECENSESLQLSLESTGNEVRTDNDDGEGRDRGWNGSLSLRCVRLMCMNPHHLRPHERRLLSRRLDKMCLVLVLGFNIITCIIFFCIWSVAK